MSLSTSEVLTAAADALEREGWTHGSGWPGLLERSEGRLCLEGALMVPLGLTTNDMDASGDWTLLTECDAYLAVKDYLGGDAAHPFLYAWNDKPGRTAEEVIGMLRDCAALEREKELV